MTRSMTRWMLAGFMALVALGVVGARAQADPPANPFAGSWSGVWAHVDDGVVGTWDDWTISDAGRISGTFYSITNNFGGAISGYVDADGKLLFVGHARGSGFPFKGTAEIDEDGRLVVSVDQVCAPFPLPMVGILERS
jgi:hypothetical protein